MLDYHTYRQRKDLRERVVAFLGGRCIICGYDRCMSALDAHHVDPEEKVFSISAVTSWERLEKELRKCVCLCSRCHREVHDGLHPKLVVTDNRGVDTDGPIAIQLMLHA